MFFADLREFSGSLFAPAQDSPFAAKHRLELLFAHRQSPCELVTVLRSNLRDLVTPDLILQLQALKDHLDIDNFKTL